MDHGKPRQERPRHHEVAAPSEVVAEPRDQRNDDHHSQPVQHQDTADGRRIEAGRGERQRQVVEAEADQQHLRRERAADQKKQHDRPLEHRADLGQAQRRRQRFRTRLVARQRRKGADVGGEAQAGGHQERRVRAEPGGDDAADRRAAQHRDHDSRHEQADASGPVHRAGPVDDVALRRHEHRSEADGCQRAEQDQLHHVGRIGGADEADQRQQRADAQRPGPAVAFGHAVERGLGDRHDRHEQHDRQRDHHLDGKAGDRLGDALDVVRQEGAGQFLGEEEQEHRRAHGEQAHRRVGTLDGQIVAAADDLQVGQRLLVALGGGLGDQPGVLGPHARDLLVDVFHLLRQWTRSAERGMGAEVVLHQRIEPARQPAQQRRRRDGEGERQQLEGDQQGDQQQHRDVEPEALQQRLGHRVGNADKDGGHRPALDLNRRGHRPHLVGELRHRRVREAGRPVGQRHDPAVGGRDRGEGELRVFLEDVGQHLVGADQVVEVDAQLHRLADQAGQRAGHHVGLAVERRQQETLGAADRLPGDGAQRGDQHRRHQTENDDVEAPDHVSRASGRRRLPPADGQSRGALRRPCGRWPPSRAAPRRRRRSGRCATRASTAPAARAERRRTTRSAPPAWRTARSAGCRRRACRAPGPGSSARRARRRCRRRFQRRSGCSRTGLRRCRHWSSRSGPPAPGHSNRESNPTCR